MGAHRYGMSLGVFNSISHKWEQERVISSYVNFNTQREIPYLLVSNLHVLFCLLNILMTLFLTIFWRFPTTFGKFPKVFKKISEDQTNSSRHFPKISKDYQRFSKITEDFQERSNDVLIIQVNNFIPNIKYNLDNK